MEVRIRSIQETNRDKNDKKYIEDIKNEIKSKSDNYDRKLGELTNQLEVEKKLSDTMEAMLTRYESAISLYEAEIDRKDVNIKELYKVIADLKTTVETLSGTILHLQDEMKLIQKKITKQPMVFHDKSFISWRESSGLWMINIPDGDYLLIAKYVVWEHNEYVTNCDQLMMDTIHVEGQHYIPFYKLEWGTELDTPTATIYYDLVFIPM